RFSGAAGARRARRPRGDPSTTARRRASAGRAGIGGGRMGGVNRRTPSARVDGGRPVGRGRDVPLGWGRGAIAGRVMLSIVIPVFDENDSLGELHREIAATADRERLDVEIIFVDDGSRDGSWEAICDLARRDRRVRGLRLRRNFGKAAALSAGVFAAPGGPGSTPDPGPPDDPDPNPPVPPHVN